MPCLKFTGTLNSFVIAQFVLTGDYDIRTSMFGILLDPKNNEFHLHDEVHLNVAGAVRK